MKDEFVQILLTLLVDKFKDFENKKKIKDSESKKFTDLFEIANSYLSAFDDLFVHCIGNGLKLDDFDADLRKKFDEVLNALLEIFEYLDHEFINPEQHSFSLIISKKTDIENLKITLSNFYSKIRFYKISKFFLCSQSRLSNLDLSSKNYLFFDMIPGTIPFDISTTPEDRILAEKTFRNSNPYKNKLFGGELNSKIHSSVFTKILSKNDSSFESNKYVFSFVVLLKILFIYFVAFLISCFSVYGLLYLFFERI